MRVVIHMHTLTATMQRDYHYTQIIIQILYAVRMMRCLYIIGIGIQPTNPLEIRMCFNMNFKGNAQRIMDIVFDKGRRTSVERGTE